MAGTKEIRTKIASVKNTQKITSAMEMVATSKMRKAQQRRSSSRPYAESMYRLIGHLANANPDYLHPFMVERKIERVGYIIISSDRGLCGGLNTNLFKKAVAGMKTWHDQNVEIDLCLIGTKAEAFFRTHGGNVVATTSQLGENVSVTDLVGSIKVMLDSFSEGRIDLLQIVFNNFVNTMSQEAWDIQLLPLKSSDDLTTKHQWDYIYEPNGKTLLDVLMIRYIETLIYQAVVENNACEQAARMVAMKSATDNAGELIDQLQLIYNKARQAAITQEISEIVSGAAAV